MLKIMSSKNKGSNWGFNFLVGIGLKLKKKAIKDGRLTKISWDEAERVGLLDESCYIGHNLFQDKLSALGDSSDSIWRLETEADGTRFLIKDINEDSKIIHKVVSKVKKNKSKKQVDLKKKAGALIDYPSHVLSRIDKLMNTYDPEDIHQILLDQIKLDIPVEEISAYIEEEKQADVDFIDTSKTEANLRKKAKKDGVFNLSDYKLKIKAFYNILKTQAFPEEQYEEIRAKLVEQGWRDDESNPEIKLLSMERDIQLDDKTASLNLEMFPSEGEINLLSVEPDVGLSELSQVKTDVLKQIYNEIDELGLEIAGSEYNIEQKLMAKKAAYGHVVYLQDSQDFNDFSGSGGTGIEGFLDSTEEEMVEYLSQWDDGEYGQAYAESDAGPEDTQAQIGDYLLTYNSRLGYAGLEKIIGETDAKSQEKIKQADILEKKSNAKLNKKAEQGSVQYGIFGGVDNDIQMWFDTEQEATDFLNDLTSEDQKEVEYFKQDWDGGERIILKDKGEMWTGIGIGDLSEEAKKRVRLTKKAISYGDLEEIEKAHPEKQKEYEAIYDKLFSVALGIYEELGIQSSDPIRDDEEMNNRYLEIVKEKITEKVPAPIYLWLEDNNAHIFNSALVYLDLFEPTLEITQSDFGEQRNAKLNKKAQDETTEEINYNTLEEAQKSIETRRQESPGEEFEVSESEQTPGKFIVKKKTAMKKKETQEQILGKIQQLEAKKAFLKEEIRKYA